MGLVSHPFNRTPIPVHKDGGTNHSKMKCLCQGVAKENFILAEEEVNWNHNPHVTPPSSISLKPKTPDLLNFSDYKWVHPFVKTLFKETRKTIPLAGRLIYFLKNWGKATNDSTILSIVKGYSINFVTKRLLTKKNTNKGKIKPSLGKTCIIGCERNAGEGCRKRGKSMRGPVCQSSVSSIIEV